MPPSRDGWEDTEITATGISVSQWPCELGAPTAQHLPQRPSPLGPPSAARPSWEGAYLCSPNLESIEAEWLHFKRNYYKPFRECEFQNEISLSKLSLMCRCCAGIGLHPCLQALNGDQILGGATHREPALASLPTSSLQTLKIHF